MAKKRVKRTPAELTGKLLFFTLIISALYSLVRIVIPKPLFSDGTVYAHVRSDYVLMFIQCLLGLGVLSLPSVMARKWKFTIPNFIYIMYYIFLYCAIFLGEVLNFYYVIPHWDVILHFFSGAMLGALGFILVSQLNDSDMIRVSLSPFFVALFAFCFALSCGAVWEVYEFVFDGLLGLNMQKFITATGEVLVGHAALHDTMTDVIVDALAALLISIIGYSRLKADKWFSKTKE
ncbi:MAG: hypothetical protein PUD63_05880 [Clostridia bacterium]|nr:hypothetical protein [Clostridia bacterium]MDD6040712.1 hypothetical protein [Clostridia bacterium]